MYGWGDMPIASTNHNLQGTSMEVNLMRIGNLVMVRGNFVSGPHSAADAQAYQNTWGLIPQGYRPQYTSRIIMTGVVTERATGGWEISSDGKKTWSTPGWTGTERFYVNCSWITADEWPS